MANANLVKATWRVPDGCAQALPDASPSVPFKEVDMYDFDDEAEGSDNSEAEGTHCDACGEWLEPGRKWCPTCGSDR